MEVEEAMVAEVTEDMTGMVATGMDTMVTVRIINAVWH